MNNFLPIQKPWPWAVKFFQVDLEALPNVRALSSDPAPVCPCFGCLPRYPTTSMPRLRCSRNMCGSTPPQPPSYVARQ